MPSSFKIQRCLYIIHVSERHEQFNRRKSSVVFNVNLPLKTDLRRFKRKNNVVCS